MRYDIWNECPCIYSYTRYEYDKVSCMYPFNYKYEYEDGLYDVWVYPFTVHIIQYSLMDIVRFPYIQ